MAFGEPARMKRMKLSAEEAAIIEGLRHERAIYNKAIEDALQALTKEGYRPVDEMYKIYNLILSLRNE